MLRAMPAAVLLAALLTALPAAARAAEAGDLVEAFSRYCMATEGDPAAALAAAAADGWTASPDDPRWRYGQAGGETIGLLAYEKTKAEGAQTLRMRNCVVGVSGKYTAGLDKAFTARAGRPPDLTLDDRITWAYQETRAGRQPVAANAGLERLADGPAYSYGVMGKPGQANVLIFNELAFAPSQR